MEIGVQRRNTRLIKLTIWVITLWASIPFLWILRDVGRMVFAPIVYYDNGVFFTWLKNTSILYSLLLGSRLLAVLQLGSFSQCWMCHFDGS